LIEQERRFASKVVSYGGGEAEAEGVGAGGAATGGGVEEELPHAVMMKRMVVGTARCTQNGFTG
jgi:hypothetical protein